MFKGRSNTMANSNVHDRHDQPNEDDVADQNTNGKTKTSQKVRDAHFLETGVKADGTTGDKHFAADGDEVEGDA
jgi:hypothetical protein